MMNKGATWKNKHQNYFWAEQKPLLFVPQKKEKLILKLEKYSLRMNVNLFATYVNPFSHPNRLQIFHREKFAGLKWK